MLTFTNNSRPSSPHLAASSPVGSDLEVSISCSVVWSLVAFYTVVMRLLVLVCAVFSQPGPCCCSLTERFPDMISPALDHSPEPGVSVEEQMWLAAVGTDCAGE